ncbi:calponin homology domain-containing protein DDB_G0272472-like isoform X1 [Carassius carassius]|uniref:calponin homology domain-containing protein DDB_G0272472-like isoform X1 n=1 Tax=Carassius carassius TaxID=217509 RepID=UPI002868E119|nr:calponin homology domain-containing protein DDB_G0272472-like isoform X1 [Carassius carassius]
MSKLQVLSLFLTERLTLAAQEIFKAVEDVFSEYNEEICRSRLEIELLKRRLQQTGVQMESVTQLCASETQGQKYNQTFSEEWKSDHDLKDTAMHMILDICTKEEENEEDMSVCGESASLSPCVEIYHDQTPSKDTETQVMDSSENNCHFIEQAARIKNEPETYITCQIQHNITNHGSDDSGVSDVSTDINKVKVSHIGSPRHETQTFNVSLNQEILSQHRRELAQIRERMSLKILPCDSDCKIKKSEPTVCQDEVSKSGKQKPDNARYSQAWRERLEKNPEKFVEFRAFEAEREYRRKRTATSVEIDKNNNRERQRRFRTNKKLQHHCKADDNPQPPKKTKVLTEEERMKKREYDRIKKREERERMGDEKKRQIRERDASQKREKRNKTKFLTGAPHTNFGSKLYSWN